MEQMEAIRIVLSADCKLHTVVAQWLEHWQLKPDVLGLILGSATFFAVLSRFKGLRTVTMPIMTCFNSLPFLRSSNVAPSIGPSLRT